MFRSRSLRLLVTVVVVSIVLVGITIPPVQGNESVPARVTNQGNHWSYLPIFMKPYLGLTIRASVASNGTEGNDTSWFPDISDNGRYVAFSSFANNLVPGDTNGDPDVFVHDLQTGQTSRVSIASDGTEGNSWSNYASKPSISGDGRYVAFTSNADNLVSGDTNDTYDIFVHDRHTGQTRRVSVASNGTQGNAWSYSPVVSADGRHIVFSSAASNLVSDDTNGQGDVFIHDHQTGITQIVSVTANGVQGDSHSDSPSVSADGRYVAFVSYATNIVAGDTNDESDVFVRDRQTGQTIRASVASDGTQANSWSGWLSEPSISADGRYVAFTSDADNLINGDTNGKSDIFVHDRQTGQTTRVSVAPDGTQGGTSQYPSLSADGRYVAFESLSSNWSPFAWRVYVHDRQTGQLTLVSVSSDGSFPYEGQSGQPSTSGDGRYVTFFSAADELVSGDTNGVEDVFVYDRGE